MRKPPGTLGLKKFGPGKLRVKKVWAQDISIDFLAEVDHFKIFCTLKEFKLCKGAKKSLKMRADDLSLLLRSLRFQRCSLYYSY